MKKTFLLIVVLLIIPYTMLTAKTKETVSVTMETTLGNIVIELYPDKAPKTVANFLKYVEEGYYNDLIFHRAINGFMVQGGGFDKDLKQKKTYAPVVIESNNGVSNLKGTIAMARTNDPHSATSQFFINHQDNLFLDYKAKTAAGYGYTVFGKVVKGMDVVDKIALLKTRSRRGFNDIPDAPAVIKSVNIIKKK